MQDQIDKYTEKLFRDGAAEPGQAWFYAFDDRLLCPSDDPLAGAGENILNRLHAAGLLLVRPREPWAHLLAERLGTDAERIYPRDSETKTFFHDIPIVRDRETGERGGNEPRLVEALLHRKGAVLTSGLVAARANMTLEQAYITFSSVMHACFVAYHLDLLGRGYLLPDERRLHDEALVRRAAMPVPDPGLLLEGPLAGGETIRREMCRAGSMLVEGGLVDSFFGNLSYFDGDTIWISRTAASLDELNDAIDPVRLDGTSTAGVTASSELPAHRAIYEKGGVRAILHGHPKFSVVASMICTEQGCTITDCGKLCSRVRYVPVEGPGRGETGASPPGDLQSTLLPIVSGEIGAGGLARKVPSVIDRCGAALVYGHGLFAVGRNGFREAMERMICMETAARNWVLDGIRRRSGLSEIHSRQNR